MTTVDMSTQIDPREAVRLRAHAEAVAQQRADVECLWDKGFTRRRFLAGVGMVGAAALGSQLITTRASYAAAADPTSVNTLVVIFLRGAADGLRIVQPSAAELGGDRLQALRPKLFLPESQTVALDGSAGWAMNAAMKPLAPFWASRELSFVPAVSADGLNRSHFEAQQLLETGGNKSSSTGWLDRVLQQLGPGTTFRAMSEGWAEPMSMSGEQQKLVLSSLADFRMPGWAPGNASLEDAVASLYRGLDLTLTEDVTTTLAALGTVKKMSTSPQNGAAYPANDQLGKSLADLATVLRAEQGLQVATLDVGGWDTHTDEVTDLDKHLTSLSGSLAAFLTDLGPVRRQRVTVAVMTEFGRRVAQNSSGGSDHGHGSLMWLLGGGINGGTVQGRWTGLDDATLSASGGDVPGTNQAFDVLGELVQKRLTGNASLSAVFPGHSYTPLGVTA